MKKTPGKHTAPKSTAYKSTVQAQLFSLLLASLLGLALFISPYQLHNNPASIFFVKITSDVASSAPEAKQHSQHQHHKETQVIHCLRCVLYGFQVPETLAPFIVILVVLGFLKLVKLAEPFSFISLSKNARAPPVGF
jgi:hypothetical protein